MTAVFVGFAGGECSRPEGVGCASVAHRNTGSARRLAMTGGLGRTGRGICLDAWSAGGPVLSAWSSQAASNDRAAGSIRVGGQMCLICLPAAPWLVISRGPGADTPLGICPGVAMPLPGAVFRSTLPAADARALEKRVPRPRKTSRTGDRLAGGRSAAASLAAVMTPGSPVTWVVSGDTVRQCRPVSAFPPPGPS